MTRGNRAFVIVLSLLIVVGFGLFVLDKFYLREDAPAPAVHVVQTTPTAASAMASRLPGVVYTTDFSTGIATGWSNTHIGETHKPPQRKFLGPFGEEPVTFTLDGLPAHQFIHLTFELLTYEPWNGDSGNFGRDLWDMRVVGGQPLIHTTFSNCAFFENNNEQSFPDQYPWYPTHPGWTGAASHQSLGFTTTWNRNGTFGTDSTYAFDITFPQTGPTLALQFKSQTKQHQNHPYGFLNFKVETVDHPASASEEQIAGWWSDLAGEDASKAYQAVWSLIALGNAATITFKSISRRWTTQSRSTSIKPPALTMAPSNTRARNHGNSRERCTSLRSSIQRSRRRCLRRSDTRARHRARRRRGGIGRALRGALNVRASVTSHDPSRTTPPPYESAV